MWDIFKTKPRGTKRWNPEKWKKTPTYITRPVVTMLIHAGNQKHPVQVLLDTGCSITLINQQTARQLGIQHMKHAQSIRVENYTGETVKDTGQFHTAPMLLQQRRHYMQESVKITPMETGIDIFLPFQGITKHPPQGAWSSNEIRFNCIHCLENCTKFEANEFFLTLD